MWMHGWLPGWPNNGRDNPSPARTGQPAPEEEPCATSVGRPPTTARVLADIRTRGYYSDIPTTLATGQSWRDLAGWWRISHVALAFEPSVQRKLQWVALRAAVLDEMEASDPERFSGWLARQYPSGRGRRRR